MIRFFDIFFSLFALVMLLPIFIPIMIILKLTGEGEIFYLQERIGKGGKPFALIKFATMLKNSDSIGTGEMTISNDPRVLPFGKFLRKTKINELPQLLNILKGDMSVIGPRPQTRKYYFAFSEETREYISKVVPGLSGIGSVVFRDEESMVKDIEDPVSFDLKYKHPYKGELEKWFVENRSTFIYFQLITLTVLAVIFSDKKYYKHWLKNLPHPPEELAKFL